MFKKISAIVTSLALVIGGFSVCNFGVNLESGCVAHNGAMLSN